MPNIGAVLKHEIAADARERHPEIAQALTTDTPKQTLGGFATSKALAIARIGRWRPARLAETPKSGGLTVRRFTRRNKKNNHALMCFSVGSVFRHLMAVSTPYPIDVPN
jgi:hypothetical protein